MKEYFESTNIEYLFTLGMLQLLKDKSPRSKNTLEDLRAYNHKLVHSVNKFTPGPADAMKPGNLAQVKFNLDLRANKQRITLRYFIIIPA